MRKLPGQGEELGLPARKTVRCDSPEGQLDVTLAKTKEKVVMMDAIRRVGEDVSLVYSQRSSDCLACKVVNLVGTFP